MKGIYNSGVTNLEKIDTADGLILNGIFFSPKKRIRRAVLFIHGFPGNFYLNSEIINNLEKEFNKSGFGLLSLNTRGHDIINVTFKKNGEILILGSAFEKFEDCIIDINAGIKFLNSKGFDEIILIGISGGADKVGFYLSKNPNKSVKGVIFLSPGSNISIINKELKGKFKQFLKKAFEMIKEGRGNELILTSAMEIPVSWQRFISLYAEESNENVFPFNNHGSEFKILSEIKLPALIILGDKDRYFDDYNLEEIMILLKEKMKKTPKFDARIIEGANHRFESKERELSILISNWIKKH